MRLAIAHTTTYSYDSPFVGETYMEARLRPLNSPGCQRCHEFRLTTAPDAPVFEYSLASDGGSVAHFTLKDQGHSELVICAESVVETLRANPFESIDFTTEDWSSLESGEIRSEQAEWLVPTALTPNVDWPAADLPRRSVFAFGQALMDRIFCDFEYVPGATEISTPLDTFVRQKRGVCQDYAHLMTSIARASGVPARYVSGYVYSGSDRTTHGSDATHAWAELYIPHTHGWIGFDPTNNVIVADRHVKVAAGRDYADVPPTKGVLRPGRGYSAPAKTNLIVDVHVTELE